MDANTPSGGSPSTDTNVVGLRRKSVELDEQIASEATAIAHDAAAGAEGAAQQIHAARVDETNHLNDDINRKEKTLAQLKEKREAMKNRLKAAGIRLAIILAIFVGAIFALDRVGVVSIGHDTMTAQDIADLKQNLAELKGSVEAAKSAPAPAPAAAGAVATPAPAPQEQAAAQPAAPAAAPTATPAPVQTNFVSIENWKFLNAVYRSQVIYKACGDNAKWSQDLDANDYQAALATWSESDAKQLVQSCDLTALTKKAQDLKATQVVDKGDPNADEDNKVVAQKVDPEKPFQVADTRINANVNLGGPPSPFIIGRPGYAGRPGFEQGRGNPRCPSGMTFAPELGKCRGPERDIPLNAYQQRVLSECPTRIETRWVQRGSRMVQQQRCAPGV